MPAGRPKTPTALKVLRGTYRPDRDGALESLAEPEGQPVMPEDLDPIAQDFWRRLVPELVALGVAKAMDSPALAEMCRAWSRMQTLGARMDELLANAESVDYFRLQCVRNQEMKSWRDLAAKFGLTPSDRARLRIEKPKKVGVATRSRIG